MESTQASIDSVANAVFDLDGQNYPDLNGLVSAEFLASLGRTIRPPEDVPPSVLSIVQKGLLGKGKVVVLVGHQLSIDRGMIARTSREAGWIIGGKNYAAKDIITAASFSSMPQEVWAYFLWQRHLARSLVPGAAHRAIANIERSLQNRFFLVDAGADGLTLRAGCSPGRTHAVHGNLEQMRCSKTCGAPPEALPSTIIGDWPKTRRLTPGEFAELRCSTCGAPARPHNLWRLERLHPQKPHMLPHDEVLDVTCKASFLVTIGVLSAAGLPLQLGRLASYHQIPLLVINPETNEFTDHVLSPGFGLFWKGNPTTLVPQFARIIATFAQ